MANNANFTVNINNKTSVDLGLNPYDPTNPNYRDFAGKNTPSTFTYTRTGQLRIDIWPKGALSSSTQTHTSGDHDSSIQLDEMHAENNNVESITLIITTTATSSTTELVLETK